MSAYNPGRPCALGCQLFPPSEPGIPLSGYTPNTSGRGIDSLGLRAGGAVLVSSAAETIEEVQIGLAGVPNSVVTRGSYELEVYEADTLPSGATILSSYFPDASKLTSPFAAGWNGFATDGPPASNAWDYVNDPTNTPGTIAGITVPDDTFLFSPTGVDWRASFGATLAGTLAGAMIVAVRIHADVGVVSDAGSARSASFVPFIDQHGERSDSSPRSVNGKLTRITSTWTSNPYTGVSWKPQDLDEFDTDASVAFGVRAYATGSPAIYAVCYRIWLEVEYLATDPRVAVATWQAGDPRYEGWNAAPVTQPDGTVGWAKADATEYLFVIRRRTGTGDALWRFIESADRVQEPDWRRADPALTYPSFLVSGWAEADNSVPALLMLDDLGGCSPDSQVYLSVGDERFDTSPFFEQWTHVDVAHQLRQYFTTGAGDTYGYVRLLASLEQPTVAAPLEVTIVRAADDVAMTDTLVFTQDDLAPPRQGFQVLEAEFATPGVLAGATDYYVLLESTAAEGEAWRVQVLSTLQFGQDGAPPTCAPERTYGGDTEYLEVAGADSDFTLDAAVTVHNRPPAPTGLAAAVVALGELCVSAIEVTWEAADVEECGLVFSHLELQRSQDGGTTWEDVARITDPAVETFTDLEARRGVEACYRARAVRSDHAPSAWTDTDCATTTDTCCGFLLASNELGPDWALWYDDLGRREWTRPENSRTVEYFGRNGAVRWGEAEDRFDAFTVDLILAADGAMGGTALPPTGTDRGRAAFDRLCQLCSSQLFEGAKVTPSYVAVLDSFGRRWLAALSVGPLVYDADAGNLYRATVAVREVTDVPSTPDQEAPGS